MSGLGDRLAELHLPDHRGKWVAVVVAVLLCAVFAGIGVGFGVTALGATGLVDRVAATVPPPPPVVVHP
ncbi:MAG: hypothetical protein ACRDRD_22455, partial [Pseudonocardiaceae bacterium]